MTTPVWPAQLNYLAERGSFKLGPGSAPLRSEFDYGPARTRQRFTRQVSSLSMALEFNAVDFEVFRAFYLHTLNNGTDWFIIPTWTGSEYLAHTVRFVEPWSAADSAFRRVKVSATLELKRMTTWDGATAFFVGEYSEEALFDIGDRLSVAVDVNYPAIVENV